MENLGHSSTNGDDAIRLSKRVILYFELDHIPRLRTSHPDDSLEDVVDFHATEVSTQALAHDLYNPVCDMLLNVAQENTQVKIAMAVSGQSLDLLTRYAPEVMEKLKRLNETGSIEWLGMPYNNSVSILISEDVYKEEVVRNSDLIFQHFGVRPKVLLATPFFDGALVNIAPRMGFEALLIKPGVWPGRAVVRDNTREIVFVSTNGILTEAVSRHFGAGEATLSVDQFVTQVNATPDHTVAIGFPFELFQDHREAGILLFFQKFLHRASTVDKLVHPIQVIHQYDEVLQWPAGLVADTSLWMGNDMQRDALASSRHLEQATQNLLDSAIRRSWLQLLARAHYAHMSDSGLTSPYLSTYEAFTNYKNLLNSLTRSLESAPLLEDYKTAKSVEYERQHPNTPTWAITEQNKYQEITRSNI